MVGVEDEGIPVWVGMSAGKLVGIVALLLAVT